MDDRRLLSASGSGRPRSTPRPFFRRPAGRRAGSLAPVCLAAALACAPEPPGADTLVGVSEPPGVPTALAARADGPETVDVSWRPPSVGADAVERYRLYRDGKAVADPAGTSHSDRGLAPFTSYEYRVSALDAGGAEGQRSGPVTARTLDATPPGVPGDVAATAVSSTQIDLTWTAAADAESGVAAHVVYRDGAAVGTSGATSFSDTGLEPSTSYSYRVAARNGDGLEGAKSEAATAATAPPRDPTPPTAPAGLTAAAVSPSQVDLSWSPATDPESGISRYRIYRDGARVGEASGTSFSDTGLEPGKAYAYRVSAVNGEGMEGPAAGEAQAETPGARDATPPTAPGSLAARATGPSSATVTWTAASDPETGVAFYRVYRDGGLQGEVGGTSFADAGLDPSTTYAYEVSAVNGDGLEGPRAGPAAATTGPDDTPPTAPTGLTAEATGSTEVTVTWTAASDPESGVTSYRVYRGGVLVGTASGPTFTEGGLTPRTTYGYEVSAVNGEGLEGPRAGPASVTTPPDDTPPGAPQGLAGEAAGPTSVELTWSPATDAESGVAFYRVYRDGALRADGVTVASFTDQGLVSSTPYAYEVSAVNGEDLEGPRAGPVSVTTDPDDSNPTAPTGLTATAASSSSIRLTWSPAADPESGIAGYRVFRDGDEVGTPAGTSFLDTGLRASTEYAYRVAAVNGEGLQGPLSGIRRATTAADGTPPTAPSGLSATVAGTNTVELAWSASTDPESGVDRYEVWRNGAIAAEVATTGYTDIGAFPGETYTYLVRAVNGAGLPSAFSDPEEITIPGDDDEATVR